MFKYFPISQRLAKLPLVELCEKIAISPDGINLFITISPSPAAKHSVKLSGKNCTEKIAYRKLPVQKQYEYLISYFRRAYFSRFSDSYTFIMTFELNKSGLLHAHVIAHDDMIKNEYDLRALQSGISEDYETRRNSVKNKDWMNNIVFITKPLKEVHEYLFKDYEMSSKYFPGITNVPNSDLEEIEVKQPEKTDKPEQPLVSMFEKKIKKVDQKKATKKKPLHKPVKSEKPFADTISVTL